MAISLKNPWVRVATAGITLLTGACTTTGPAQISAIDYYADRCERYIGHYKMVTRLAGINNDQNTLTDFQKELIEGIRGNREELQSLNASPSTLNACQLP